MADTAGEIRQLEIVRLRALVGVDAQVLDQLHATDFVLVHPSGGTWTKDQ
ncbi:MAG TPA: nuclear transport factor 2 family protein [Jiangellales bacterium]|nr:nuclear transport factor 2 family protein [Jiangellales bacterium]